MYTHKDGENSKFCYGTLYAYTGVNKSFSQIIFSYRCWNCEGSRCLPLKEAVSKISHLLIVAFMT